MLSALLCFALQFSFMSASTSNLSNRSAPPAPSVMLYDLLDAGDEAVAAAAAAPPAPARRLSYANGVPRPVSNLMHASSSGRLSTASASGSFSSLSRQSLAHQQTQFVAPAGVAPRATRPQAASARPRPAQAAASSAAVGSGSSLQRSSSMRIMSRAQPPPNAQQLTRGQHQLQVAQAVPQQTLHAAAAVAPAARAAAFEQMRASAAPPQQQQPQSLLMRPASALGNYSVGPAMAALPTAPGGGKQMLLAQQRLSMAANGFVPQASLRSVGQMPPPAVDQYTSLCLRQALL